VNERTGTGWREGLAAACAGLVHPRTGGDERLRQARLIGVLLIAPLLAGPLIAQLLWQHGLSAHIPASACLSLVAGWSGAVLVARSGSRVPIEQLAAALLGLLLAIAIAAGGVLHSPLLLLLAAPPLEFWFIARSRRAVLAGGLLSLAALGLAVALPGAGSGFAGHFWLTPLAWAATVCLRLPLESARSRGHGFDPGELARLTGTLVAEAGPQGTIERISGRSEDLLGVPPLVLLGSGLFDRMQVTDRVTYLAGIDRLLRERKELTVAVRIRAAGGARYVPCALTLAPMREDSVWITVRPAVAEEAPRKGGPVVRRICEERRGEIAFGQGTEQGHEETRRVA
jgi:cell cycle sensor histidine kinase DivJ